MAEQQPSLSSTATTLIAKIPYYYTYKPVGYRHLHICGEQAGDLAVTCRGIATSMEDLTSTLVEFLGSEMHRYYVDGRDHYECWKRISRKKPSGTPCENIETALSSILEATDFKCYYYAGGDDFEEWDPLDYSEQIILYFRREVDDYTDDEAVDTDENACDWDSDGAADLDDGFKSRFRSQRPSTAPAPAPTPILIEDE